MNLKRLALAGAGLALSLVACGPTAEGSFNQTSLQRTLTEELAAKGYDGQTVKCPRVQDHDKANAVYVCTAQDVVSTRYVTVTRNHDRSGYSWALTPAVEGTP